MIVGIIFVVTIIIGIPIAFVLGIVGMVHLIIINPSLLVQLPQRIFMTASNYSLLAIPLFILAGDLMSLSGDVDRLLRFARSLVGHLKGGLCYVMTLLGLMLGTSLASSNAEAALLSTSLYPTMRKEGYSDTFLAGLICATSVCGPLIPPGMLMVVYGVASGTSIKDIFLAGIMTGVYLAVALSLVVFLIGRNKNWPKTKFPGWKEVWVSFKEAALSICLPLLVLICIAVGVCTPTEAAAVLAFVLLLNGLFNYKTITIKKLYPIFLRAGVMSGAILFISAMGGVFGWTLAYDQVPQKISNMIINITQNPAVVLLILNVLVLFFGMIMDPIPAVMILVPVLMPLVSRMGYDPVHFGLMICFNLTIGLLTPPVGTVLYTTSIATGVSVNRLFKSIWPWVGICIFVLLFITYIPNSIMWIPRLCQH